MHSPCAACAYDAGSGSDESHRWEVYREEGERAREGGCVERVSVCTCGEGWSCTQALGIGTVFA